MDGQIIMEKEHTIVSAAERITRQFLPCLFVIAGIGFVYYSLYINTSDPYKSTTGLVFCGIFAPVIQLMGTLFSSTHPHKMCASLLNSIVALTSFITLRFGEYIAYDVFHISMTNYAFDPGVKIESTCACVAGTIVIVLALCPPQTSKK